MKAGVYQNTAIARSRHTSLTVKILVSIHKNNSVPNCPCKTVDRIRMGHRLDVA